jgi:hypothetical protein
VHTGRPSIGPKASEVVGVALQVMTVTPMVAAEMRPSRCRCISPTREGGGRERERESKCSEAVMPHALPHREGEVRRRAGMDICHPICTCVRTYCTPTPLKATCTSLYQLVVGWLLSCASPVHLGMQIE